MTAFYCVVVDGPHKGGPRVAHATLEIAATEAARLHAKLGGQYAVRILETVRELPATAPIAEPAPKPDPAPQKPAQAVQASAGKAKVQAGAKPAQKAPVVVVKKARKLVDLRD